MILRLKEIRSVLEAAQTQSVSMRRRLMLYLFTIMLFFAFLIAMLLFLFGAIDPIGYEIERALSSQLENSADSIEQMLGLPSTNFAILLTHWSPCKTGSLMSSAAI